MAGANLSAVINSMISDSTALVVFVKLPVPGKVKTRLAASIGNDAASQFYALCSKHILHICSLAGVKQLVVQHSHGDSPRDVNQWVDEMQLQVKPMVLSQCVGDDLGAKMMSALQCQLSKPGINKVVVVGSDIPDLSPDALHVAFKALDRYEVVIGPALDGGYYLLGLTRMIPALFQGIPWSTSEVLQCTMEAAAATNARVAPRDTLPTLRDIDTLHDLKQWFDQSTSLPYKSSENVSIVADTANLHQKGITSSDANAPQAPAPLQTSKVPDSKHCLYEYVEDLLREHMPCQVQM